MNQEAICGELRRKHELFISYMNGLSAGDYEYRYAQKWTAGQQLQHIVLCVAPLVQVFGMDKAAIAERFGTTDRAGRSYEALKNEYNSRLGDGGRAPDRYVPEDAAISRREELTGALKNEVDRLCIHIGRFSEPELDTLLIPHPLLGSLSLREMLYNALYHVEHHQQLTQRYLNYKTN